MAQLKLVISSRRLVKKIIETGGPDWTFDEWPSFSYLFRTYADVKLRWHHYKNIRIVR